MPISAAGTLLAIALAPGWRLFKNDRVLDIEQLRGYLAIFALDASGLSGFVAFGSLLLAINRIEVTSQASIDAETAVRAFIILRFRNFIQWAAILGASTAPIGGIIWIILNSSQPDWPRSTLSIAAACAALWIVLLLSVPGSGYFGMQSIAKEWAVNHAAFRRDMLVRNWGSRWGTRIQEAPVKRRQAWHVIWRWLIVALAATVEIAILSQLIDEMKPDWGDPRTLPIFATLFIYNSYVGGIILLVAGWICEAGIAAAHRGWRKTGLAIKFLAASLGPSVAIAFMVFDYFPFSVMAWTIAILQVGFVLGMLNNGNLKNSVWFPVRGMVLNARSQSHRWAYLRWRSLDALLNTGLEDLPRRQRKRKKKEISQWRDRITNSEI